MNEKQETLILMTYIRYLKLRNIEIDNLEIKPDCKVLGSINNHIATEININWELWDKLLAGWRIYLKRAAKAYKIKLQL